jgi:hypothetical protein
MTLDYAFVPFNLAGDAHRASLTIELGDAKVRDVAVDHKALLSSARFAPLVRDTSAAPLPTRPKSSYFTAGPRVMNRIEYLGGPEDKRWVADAAQDFVRGAIALSGRSESSDSINYSGGCKVEGESVFLLIDIYEGDQLIASASETSPVEAIGEMWRRLDGALRRQLAG